jgi:hypothetical protein
MATRRRSARSQARSAAIRRWQGVILLAVLLAGGWLVRQIEWGAPRASGPSPFHLKDVTREMGIDYRFQDPVLDQRIAPVQRLFFIGGAVAVADVNGDGWPDIFLAPAKQGEPAKLYLNRGGNRFEDAAQAWGVAQRPPGGATLVPVFFDFNNDGRPDLYLAGLGCSVLYRNDGDHFTDVSKASGATDCLNSSGAVPFDFDGDGNLDLYVLRYWGPHDFFNLESPYVLYENLVDARNGGRNTYLRNRGDGTFEDVTDRLGGGDYHWTYDAAVADFSGDGKFELLVVNDFGPDQLYSVEAGGKLVNISDRLGFPDRRLGMGVSLADVAGSGRAQPYVSNEYIEGWNETGNFFWNFRSSGHDAVDMAPKMGVANCQWSWGAAFVDLDLDGREDLYVANGLLTGTGLGEYEFAIGTVTGLPGALLSDYRNWAPLGTRSFQGHQQDCLFHNTEQGFVDVFGSTGVQIPPDGRSVALIDFDNNGAMDLLIGTQNEPGTVHLLKNEQPPGDHWISIEPIGRKTNRDAVGAVVAVTQEGRTQRRFATGGKTGFHAISDKRLHFGLPGHGPVDVEIRWPSGHVQKVSGLEPGRHHRIEEDVSR